MEALVPRFVTSTQLALMARCNQRALRDGIRSGGIAADAILESPFGAISLFSRARVDELVRAATATTNTIPSAP